MTLFLFIPETLIVVLAMVLFFIMLAKKETSSKIVYPFMVFSGFLLIAACLFALRQSGDLFYDSYKIDLLSQGFKFLIGLAFLFTVLFSKEMFSIHPGRRPEFFFFLFTATLGMMMITSAVNILTLYISLELSAYSLYLLSALRQGRKIAEGAIKYLLFGAVSSGIFLWGFSLIAGLSGTLSLTEISKNIPMLILQPAFSLGLFFVSLAFLFKLSNFPMHFWTPDVYEVASTPVTNFIATASKATAVAILIRVLTLMGVSAAFVTILGALALISMTLGNCVAMIQQDIKRLLAYSSIAQAGYILLGLLAGSAAGYSSSFFYAFAYVLMNTGAFLVILLVAKSAGDDNPKIDHLDGLAERSPFLALLLLVSLLSLAGIPPLLGFTGKWILFSSAMDKGHWFLVLWAVINSVISLFYYLMLVRHAYLEKPKANIPVLVPLPFKILGLVLFCALIFLGIFPNFFINFAQQAVAGSMVR